MATVIRPELSKDNPYYISKHRYYELKHLCLQYPEWKREYNRLEAMGITGSRYDWPSINDVSDPTAKLAIRKTFYSDMMDLVDGCLDLTDSDLAGYLRMAVTRGLSYEKLQSRLYVPCGRTEFYRLYRKFFYILDKERR